MVGSWVKEGTGDLLMVVRGPEGPTYSVDDDGGIVPTPDDTGRLELDSSGLVLTSAPGSPSCEPGAAVVLTRPSVWPTHVTGVPSQQAMELSVMERSGCESLDRLGGTWIRVS